MKIAWLTIIFFLGMIPSYAAPKTALVIGNSNYQSSPLTNPVNDATDIAEKLRYLGFEVFDKFDLNRKQMRNAIREFGQTLKQKGGAGIFFYAGHGIQVKGENYLIPVGADIQSEFEVPDESVQANLLLRALENAGNPLNIVVLDACRDNPFARSFRSSAKGLARMEGGVGTLIAYSTGPGNVAMDGEGRNSPYTKYLLKYMTQTGLSIEQVFKRVRVGVEKDSGGRQIPWESSSLRNDFYFVPEPVELTKHSPQNQINKDIVKSKKHTIKVTASETRAKNSSLVTNALMTNYVDTNSQTTSGYKLTIYTNPGSAQIRILNLDKNYHSGITLEPGDYNLEISKEGYLSKKQWVTIDQDNVEMQITLVPLDYE